MKTLPFDGEEPPPPTAAKQRRTLDRDLWDVLARHVGPAPTTARGRGAWNSAILDLKQAGATVETLDHACRTLVAQTSEPRYRTPGAVAKNWDRLIATPSSERPAANGATPEQRLDPSTGQPWENDPFRPETWHPLTLERELAKRRDALDHAKSSTKLTEGMRRIAVEGAEHDLAEAEQEHAKRNNGS